MLATAGKKGEKAGAECGTAMLAIPLPLRSLTLLADRTFLRRARSATPAHIPPPGAECGTALLAIPPTGAAAAAGLLLLYLHQRNGQRP